MAYFIFSPQNASLEISHKIPSLSLSVTIVKAFGNFRGTAQAVSVQSATPKRMTETRFAENGSKVL